MSDLSPDSLNFSEISTDHKWLTSNAATIWIRDTQTRLLGRQDLHTVIRRLRQDLTVEKARFVLELAQCRIRGRQKFELADRMFFTRDALEMATDARIAAFKAKRFEGFQIVADICCSIGGDLIGLANRIPDVVTHGFDNDPTTVLFANQNLNVHNLPQCARQQSFESLRMSDFDAIHIDPERRKFGKSTTGDKFSPPLNQVFQRAGNMSFAVKMAPATGGQDIYPADFERQWIGHSRECKQQIVWSGELAHTKNCHRATVLFDSEICEYHRKVEFIENCRARIANRIDRYLFEPHNTIIASRLTDTIAADHDLERVGKRIAYLTGDRQIKNRLLSCFEVLDYMPADLKKLSAAIKQFGFGQLEIKHRGVTEQFAQRFKKLQKRNGVNQGTLFLTEFKGKHIAIITRRQKFVS